MGTVFIPPTIRYTTLHISVPIHYICSFSSLLHSWCSITILLHFFYLHHSPFYLWCSFRIPVGVVRSVVTCFYCSFIPFWFVYWPYDFFPTIPHSIRPIHLLFRYHSFDTYVWYYCSYSMHSIPFYDLHSLTTVFIVADHSTFVYGDVTCYGGIVVVPAIRAIHSFRWCTVTTCSFVRLRCSIPFVDFHFDTICCSPFWFVVCSTVTFVLPRFPVRPIYYLISLHIPMHLPPPVTPHQSVLFYSGTVIHSWCYSFILFLFVDTLICISLIHSVTPTFIPTTMMHWWYRYSMTLFPFPIRHITVRPTLEAGRRRSTCSSTGSTTFYCSILFLPTDYHSTIHFFHSW